MTDADHRPNSQAATPVLCPLHGMEGFTLGGEQCWECLETHFDHEQALIAARDYRTLREPCTCEVCEALNTEGAATPTA